jgi:hypothetical protein
MLKVDLHEECFPLQSDESSVGSAEVKAEEEQLPFWKKVIENIFI